MHPFDRRFSAIATPIFVFFVLTFGLAETARADAIAGDEAEASTKISALNVRRGSAAVANSGEATVSIPLMVPPGVRGVRPQLSLQYSSTGGDIGLGTGWSLGFGFPDAVRRANRFGIPLYDDEDVFTFGSQDLVKVGDQFPVRYRTRIDSFQKIEHSIGLHGFSDWLVTERNGTRLEYGGIGFQSAIPGVPRVLRIYAWHLARVIDTYGNTIKFEYEGPDTARRLKQILYTFNNGVAVGQVQKVVFHWENRPDANGDNSPDALRDSICGAEIVHDKRLDRIETYNDDHLVQVYDLVYAGDPASGTQLTPVTRTWQMVALEVTGHATDGSTDTLKWTFDYQQTEGWVDDEQYLLPDTFTLANRILANNYDLGARLVDVNADGLIDIIGRPFPNDQNQPNEVWLHNGSGWSRAPEWSVPYARFVGGSTGSEDFGIRVIDVNGDGLVDLLLSIDPNPDKSKDEKQEVRLNNGSGWDDPNTAYRLPKEAIFAISGEGDGGVRFAEVNGDSLIDLLIGRQDMPRAVYFNNGTNGWNKAHDWVLPLDFAARHGSARWHDNGVRLGDVNADGLADLVRAFSPYNKPDEREIRLNNGAGWNEPGQWTVPADVWFAYESSKGGSKPGIARLADFNGDGYIDLMGLDGNTLTAPLYLNNHSSGFFELPGLELPRDAMWAGDLGTRLEDVNADGLLDIVHAHVAVSDGGLRCAYVPDVPGCRVTYLSQGRQVDLLVGFTNPLGGEVSLQYDHASGFGLSTGQMPFVKTVVSKLSKDAGMNDPVISSSYHYEDGYYDFAQREFYGFQAVTETRSDNSRRESLFYTEEGRKGVMKEQSLRDSDGRIYRKLRLTYSGATPDAHGVYKTLLTKQENRQYHQDDVKEFVFSQKYFTYDDYGNIRTVRERDWGMEVTICEPFEKNFKASNAAVMREVGPPEECWDVLQPGPTLHSDRITYTAPNEADWIVSLPARLERFEGDLHSRNSMRLSTFEFYYDDQTTLGAEPAQGRLTRKVLRDHRLEGLELASGSETVEAAFEHDAYGNVTKKTNGRGFNTIMDYEGNGFLFAHSITRDNPGRPLIQRETIYDRGLGVLLEKTDLNDQVTRYQYDGFGRTKMIINPGETSSDPSLLADYRLDVFPGYTRIWRRIGEDDQLRYRVRSEYIDGFGRPKATVVGQDSNWVLSNLTHYDNRGRQNKIFEPFFRQNTNYTDSAPSGTGVTSYSYEDDKLSRTTFPDGAVARYMYSADGFYFYDENGVITRQRFDSQGRLVEVITDVGGSGTTYGTTRYDYDGLGYMVASEDPRGLVTEYFHDARGLLRGLSDSDGGQQTLRNGYQIWNDYDEQGNHTYRWSETDVLRTEHDALDRRTRRETSRDGGSTWSFESLYYYDISSSQNNGIGRLGFVYTTPPTSYSFFYYDIRGRVKRETLYYHSLDANLPGSINIEYDYNRAGELTGIREPLGRWIRYERNIFGQIEGKDNIAAVTLEGTPALEAIIDMKYDPAGRIKLVDFRKQ
ncbi:MAG: toxin TcdB middle/N-terminal domain-containing protein [Desulfobacterales bacterium]|jgi:YD repeat-containing protein